MIVRSGLRGELCSQSSVRYLCQNRFDGLTTHIREAVVAALKTIRESVVVQPQKMKDGGVQVGQEDEILNHMIAKLGASTFWYLLLAKAWIRLMGCNSGVLRAVRNAAYPELLRAK